MNRTGPIYYSGGSHDKHEKVVVGYITEVRPNDTFIVKFKPGYAWARNLFGSRKVLETFEDGSMLMG